MKFVTTKPLVDKETQVNEKRRRSKMSALLRVGTTYIPVVNVEIATDWYVNKLGAELSYLDEDKAILNFANQSFFLVKAKDNQSANFYDHYGKEHFSLTFEVDGLQTLEEVHKEFLSKHSKGN